VIDTNPDLAACALDGLAAPLKDLGVSALNHFTAKFVFYFQGFLLQSEKCPSIREKGSSIPVNGEYRAVDCVKEFAGFDFFGEDILETAPAYSLSDRAAFGFGTYQIMTPSTNTDHSAPDNQAQLLFIVRDGVHSTGC
jgi:hypothetical protein